MRCMQVSTNLHHGLGLDVVEERLAPDLLLAAVRRVHAQERGQRPHHRGAVLWACVRV